MALIYKQGDLLASRHRVIGHGCNALGSMGAGIATAIKRSYPGAFEVYAKTFAARGLKVGEVIAWEGNDRVVLNCITQARYGRDPNTVYVDYDGVRSCMLWIEGEALRSRESGRGVFAHDGEVAFPKIGAGLANGDWDRIAEIIDTEIKSLDVLIYVL